MFVWCLKCRTRGASRWICTLIRALSGSTPRAGKWWSFNPRRRNVKIEGFDPAAATLVPVTISLDSIPSFTEREALEMAKREFGMHGKAAPLPSERDQNFLITEASGEKFVLKIANVNDAPELLDFQNQAMRRVANLVPDCRVQRILLTRQGSDLAKAHNPRAGSDHCVRLLTWIDGEVLAKCRSRGPALFESIGADLAKIDAALRDYSHAAMRRVL